MVTKTLETLREDVRVGDIFLDESYGRPARPAHLEKMIAKWDRERVGAIYLSMRDDGSFAVIDGNHRVMACRTVEGEDATLPARVYLDLTLEDEAELFTAFNRDRKQLLPGELFKARLAAGERAAEEIYEIVGKLGLDIAWNGEPHAGLQGVATIDRIYERYGAKMLREVLLTLRNSMGSNAIQATIMRGLAAFLVRYGDICDRERLFSVLAAHSVHQIASTAHAVRTMTPTIGMESATGMAIVQLYNTGLKTKQLPPWQAKAFSAETLPIAQARGRANLSKVRGDKEWKQKVGAGVRATHARRRNGATS